MMRYFDYVQNHQIVSDIMYGFSHGITDEITDEITYRIAPRLIYDSKKIK